MSEQPAERAAESPFQRNFLWMSPEVIAAARSSHLLIIGCGGAGVLFAVYAAHVGFHRFTLCDGDLLDRTNLNRYVVATPDQIGQPKVEVLRSYLASRFPDVSITSIAAPFPNAQVLDLMPSATLAVGCIDSPITRIELDIVARKHRCPLIDLGSGFVVDDTFGAAGVILAAGGQILLSRPDGACLRCLGFDLEGTRNTYFIPNEGPEPSSILLNGIVAALAVEWGLREISGYPSAENRIEYDRGSLSITRRNIACKPTCPICGLEAAPHVTSVCEDLLLRESLMDTGIRCRTA